MLQKTSLFLLLLFFIQTVFAGIDLHHNSNNNLSNNNTNNILEHYIDLHVHKKNPQEKMNSPSFDPLNVTHIDFNDFSADGSVHHHDCHGHITSFSFSQYSLIILNPMVFNTGFNYYLSDYSIILNFPKRPPIFS
jgi:hypothetical protein